MSFGFQVPDPYLALNAEERKNRGVISSDACIIDNKQFFILGCIEIPVIGLDVAFVWNVWVSISEKSFDHVEKLWETDIRSNEPPFFGWLSNAIPGYPITFALKISVQLRDHGVRPAITLKPTDHPLALEQGNGITLARIEGIAALAHARH